MGNFIEEYIEHIDNFSLEIELFSIGDTELKTYEMDIHLIGKNYTINNTYTIGVGISEVEARCKFDTIKTMFNDVKYAFNSLKQ